MSKPTQQQSLILLSLCLLLFFNFPLLSIANKSALVNGIPILYLFIFLSWAIGIFLVYRIIEHQNPKQDPHE